MTFGLSLFFTTNQGHKEVLNMRKFMKIDDNNTNADSLIAGMKILARVAGVILALGIIGLIIWKLPIWEILTTFLYFGIIPIVLLGCFGLVSWESVKGSVQVVSMGSTTSRKAVNKIMEEWKKTAEPVRNL